MSNFNSIIVGQKLCMLILTLALKMTFACLDCGFESHLGQLVFFLEKRAVLGVVDLFVVPLPFYLLVDTA